MIRIVLFLGLLLLLALGVAWVAEREGEVVITWLGQRIELDIGTALIALLVVTILLTVLWSAVRLFLRLPSLMSMASRSRKRQKGYAAVSRGMVAIGAGDSRMAAKHASEAQRLLGSEPLTMLLSAQSAQLAGDAAKAEKAFTSMLDNGDTRVVGLRGLFIESQRRSDPSAARFYAEEAYKLAPSADWASDAALSYRCQDRDWLGAMALVEQAASRRIIDKDTARKQRATLLTADALDRGNRAPDEAFRALQEANKLDPSLIPAAAMLGRKTSEKGDYSRASRILETAWSALPHPDVAEAYLDVRLGDSAKDRLKRARNLLKIAPASAESRLVMARAAIDAREFATARDNLEALVLEQPTVRACILMAELEEASSGNMGLVREWLSRASRAERDKAWVADGRVSDSWSPVSPVSGRLGTSQWTKPPQAPGSLLIEEIAERRVAPALVEAVAPATVEPTLGVAEAASKPVDIVETKVAEPKLETAVGDAPVTALPPLTAPDDPGPEGTTPKGKWRLFG
jgi:HemY protein